jgi:sulfotransferase family protein
MTKLFLHIGPHKTGSTYIQKYFFANRDQLLKLGLNYPSAGIGPQYGHHQMIEKIRRLNQNELDEYIVPFVGSAINLVSSENFDRLKLRDIKKLGRALANLDVRIIYYCRNYVDLLPSWWQERVKHKSTISFYEFVLPHILKPFSSNIVNPGVVLDLYADVFGKSNITVIDYDAARQKDGILQPLFELLRIALGAVKNEVVNRSVKLELVEIIRALNTIAEFKGQLRSHDVRTLFLRKRRADAISVEVEDLASVIRDHMKPVELAGGFFANAVNAAFRKTYGPCFLNELPAELPNREVLVPSDNWMLERDSLKACEHIYQYIMSGEALESERQVVVR